MFNLVEPPTEVLEVPISEFNNALMNHSPYTVITLGIIMGVLGFITYSKPRTRKPVTLGLILILSLFAVPDIPFVHAVSYGDPLTTTNIGIFAYYNETTDWTLADTVSAFHNYTDHSTYYDGYIRVFQDATGNTYTGSADYVDVLCRVRADGWIMAFLNTSAHQDYHIPYYGVDKGAEPSAVMPANSTSVHRAIQRVYYAANKTFPEYENLNLYDYSNPTATIFIMMETVYEDNVAYRDEVLYFNIPNNMTVVDGAIASGGNDDSDPGDELTYDGTSLQNSTIGTFGWVSNSISPSTGSTHNVTIDQKTTGSDLVWIVVTMLWLS